MTRELSQLLPSANLNLSLFAQPLFRLFVDSLHSANIGKNGAIHNNKFVVFLDSVS